MHIHLLNNYTNFLKSIQQLQYHVHLHVYADISKQLFHLFNMVDPLGCRTIKDFTPNTLLCTFCTGKIKLS